MDGAGTWAARRGAMNLRMKRRMRSFLWIPFLAASCGGAGDAVEHDEPSSVAEPLVKCSQSQFYTSVPVEWTQRDVWVLNPATGRFDCRPGTQRMLATVICENSCNSAALICSFTDSSGATRIIDKPAREPNTVEWTACNSCNVCGGEPPPPECRHTGGGTLTGSL